MNSLHYKNLQQKTNSILYSVEQLYYIFLGSIMADLCSEAAFLLKELFFQNCVLLLD